jgi:formate dehydrogenase major subunit
MEITGQRYDFRGKTVAVIGGGNTAMDCCRTSIRCHADNVYVCTADRKRNACESN